MDRWSPARLIAKNRLFAGIVLYSGEWPGLMGEGLFRLDRFEQKVVKRDLKIFSIFNISLSI
jgi:hypothetical protein